MPKLSISGPRISAPRVGGGPKISIRGPEGGPRITIGSGRSGEGFSSRGLASLRPEAKSSLITLNKTGIRQANTLGLETGRPKGLARARPEHTLSATQEAALSQRVNMETILKTAQTDAWPGRTIVHVRPGERGTLFRRSGRRVESRRDGRFVSHDRLGASRVLREQAPISGRTAQRSEARVGRFHDHDRRGVRRARESRQASQAEIAKPQAVNVTEAQTIVPRVERQKAIETKAVISRMEPQQRARANARKERVARVRAEVMLARVKPAQVEATVQSSNNSPEAVKATKLANKVKVESNISDEIAKSLDADLKVAENAVALYIGIGVKPEVAEARVLAQIEEKYAKMGVKISQKTEAAPVTQVAEEVSSKTEAQPTPHVSVETEQDEATSQGSPKKVAEKKGTSEVRKIGTFHFGRDVASDMKRFVQLLQVAERLLRTKRKGVVVTGAEIAQQAFYSAREQNSTLKSEAASLKREDGSITHLASELSKIAEVHSVKEFMSHAAILLYKIPSVKLTNSVVGRFLGLGASEKDAERVINGEIPSAVPFHEEGVREGTLLKDGKTYWYLKKGQTLTGPPKVEAVPQKPKISLIQRIKNKVPSGNQRSIQYA